MKWLALNDSYTITSESAHVETKLPGAVYDINQNPQTGEISLSKRLPFYINEKVYGVHQEKIDKVKDSYNDFNRSLGVILSGDKGIGKSLFAKMLCKEMAESENIPVIIVDRYYNGLARFIEKIDCDVVILFDEFDKMFNEKRDMQVEFLSLFDGVTSRKRLYIITCNELSDLNNFLINRPGRFHYHFRFSYPTPEEVREYLDDHIDNKWENKEFNIQKAVELSLKFNLNYDCLRSISFELNKGRSIKEALADLNIMGDTGTYFRVVLNMKDGNRFYHNQSEFVDTLSERGEKIEFYDEVSRKNLFDIKFNPSTCILNGTKYYIDITSPNTSITMYRYNSSDELYTKLLSELNLPTLADAKSIEDPSEVKYVTISDLKVNYNYMYILKINKFLNKYGYEGFTEDKKITESQYESIMDIFQDRETHDDVQHTKFTFNYTINDIKSIELIPDKQDHYNNNKGIINCL